MRTVCYSYDSFGLVFFLFTLNLIFIIVTVTICQRERYYSFYKSDGDDEVHEKQRNKNTNQPFILQKKVDADDNHFYFILFLKVLCCSKKNGLVTFVCSNNSYYNI